MVEVSSIVLNVPCENYFVSQEIPPFMCEGFVYIEAPHTPKRVRVVVNGQVIMGFPEFAAFADYMKHHARYFYCPLRFDSKFLMGFYPNDLFTADMAHNLMEFEF